ncbi:unnamed protein product [Sphagnum troendelagicum]|uniref:Ubiquitin carboxyl-terminal hydrolase n=1 Tax=Sphagnum troendelagicum TaxID=128251 RepID=A0ABP0TQA9_9BRYO
MGKKQKRKRTVGLSKSSPRAGGSTIAAIKGVEPAFTLEGRTGKRIGAENDVVSGAVSMEELGSIRCKHVESGVNLEKLRTQLARGGLVSQCHDCSQVVLPTGRDKAGRAKVVKRKGPGPSAGDGSGGQKLWICLACGFINCGGSLLSTQTSQQSGDGEEIVKMETVTMQYMGLSHAKQHSRQREPSHPLAMEWGEDLACWCFVCDVEVDYNGEPSALNLESEGQDMASSKLKLLQQAAKLVQDKLQETKSLKIDAATTTNDNQGSESKVDEPAKVSSGNSIEAEVKPVKERCVIKGLMNLGNTCFFNSVMQNLLGVDMLWEHFSVGGSVQEGPLTTALRKFFQEIDPKSDESSDFRIHDEGGSSSFRRTTRARSFSSNIGNTYTPRDLFGAICMKAPRFKGFQQQDSHELLRCLLDGLHTEEETMWKVTKPGRNGESTKKKRETFVEKIFGGQLSSTVRCCLCGHSSVVYEPFLDLSLPIPSKQPNKKSDQPKTSTMSADANSWGSGETDQASQSVTQGVICLPYDSSFRNGSSPYRQDDGNNDVSSLKPENLSSKEGARSSLAEDQAAQTILPPVMCLPYVATDSSRSSTLVEDLDKEFAWMDYTEDIVETSSPVPTGIIVHGGSSVATDKLLTAVPEAQQSADKGQQTLDAGKECSMVVKCLSSGHQTFGNFEDIGYLTGAPYGSAEEPCGMDEIDGSARLKEDNEREEDASFPMSLEGCLLAFTKPELLSGENAWGCENCSHQLQERKEAASSLKSLHTPELESKRQDAKSGSQLQASGNTFAKGIGAGVTKTSEVLDGKNSEMQIQTEELPKVEASSGGIGGTELFETSNSLEDALNVEDPPKKVIVKRDAEKRFLINKAPPVLTVHLKRFAQDMRGRLSKLSGHVTFHEWLDISPFIDQRSSDKGVYRYRLIGIVEHSGTMRGGHYVAYVRGPVSGENRSEDVNPGSHTWFYISDSHVRQTSLESVLQSEAYLLFYEKCRIKDAGCASF